MALLVVKIFFSVFVVLSLSWVAEHVNPRIAGILSGMPAGAVLVLFFVGIQSGPEFATQSALYAVPSIVATICFAIGYYFASLSKSRLAPLFSSLVGLTCYFMVASVLSVIDFNLITAATLSLVTLVIVAYFFHSHDTNKIQSRIRMTLGHLMFRAGMAASFVVGIITISDLIGPIWSGLLMGFPMVFLPFLLVIHISYGGAQIRTIIRSFPLGLIGLICFLITVHKTIPEYGVNIAILISLCAAILYLSLLNFALNRMKPVPAKSQ